MPFVSDKQRRFFGACKGGNSKMKCPPKKVVDKFFAEERKAKDKKRKRK